MKCLSLLVLKSKTEILKINFQATCKAVKHLFQFYCKWFLPNVRCKDKFRHRHGFYSSGYLGFTRNQSSKHAPDWCCSHIIVEYYCNFQRVNDSFRDIIAMFKLDGKATYSSLGLISKQASAQYEWKLSIIL